MQKHTRPFKFPIRIAPLLRGVGGVLLNRLNTRETWQAQIFLIKMIALIVLDLRDC